MRIRGQWTKLEDHIDHFSANIGSTPGLREVSSNFMVLLLRPHQWNPLVQILKFQSVHPHPITSLLTEHQVLVTNALLRIAHGGWDVRHFLTWNVDIERTKVTKGHGKETVYWVEEGDQIPRVHAKKKNKQFHPKEGPHRTIPDHVFMDERRRIRAETGEGMRGKKGG